MTKNYFPPIYKLNYCSVCLSSNRPTRQMHLCLRVSLVLPEALKVGRLIVLSPYSQTHTAWRVCSIRNKWFFLWMEAPCTCEHHRLVLLCCKIQNIDDVNYVMQWQQRQEKGLKWNNLGTFFCGLLYTLSQHKEQPRLG